MKIYAQVSNQGTAMAETAVCQAHYASHSGRYAVVSEFNGIEMVPLNDITWHDCTGNDALSCNVCGATCDSPDLVDKTIERVEFNPSVGENPGEEPSTTLYFTDGTTHLFVHPQEQEN